MHERPTGEDPQQYERLLELTLRLSARMEHPGLLEDVLCAVGSFWGTEAGALILRDPVSSRGWVGAAMGIRGDLRSRLNGASGERFMRSILDRRQIVPAAELAIEPLYREIGDGLPVGSPRWACFLPLILHSGEGVGVIVLYHSNRPEVCIRSLHFGSILCPIIAQLIANAEREAELRQQVARLQEQSRKMHLLAEAPVPVHAEVEASGASAVVARFAIP